MRMNDFGKKDM